MQENNNISKDQTRDLHSSETKEITPKIQDKIVEANISHKVGQN